MSARVNTADQEEKKGKPGIVTLFLLGGATLVALGQVSNNIIFDSRVEACRAMVLPAENDHSPEAQRDRALYREKQCGAIIAANNQSVNEAGAWIKRANSMLHRMASGIGLGS